MTFIISLLYIIVVYLAMVIMRRQQEQFKDGKSITLLLGLLAMVALWLLLTEQIWIYWKWQGGIAGINVDDCKFKTLMYISVLWTIYSAVMMVLGFVRQVSLLRYLSLGLFTLTIVKVFTFDLSRISGIYRVAGFVVLGLILVAVSFMYQYARKKGMFKMIE